MRILGTPGDVSGQVAITYTTEANVAPLERVDLLVDGAPYAAESEAGQMTWDADDAPLGRHTLQLRAADAAGNTASDSVTVTVARPLAVAITAPSSRREVRRMRR